MTTPSRSGTQSIERSIRLLVALASHVPGGWTLADVARHCGLDKGTARRILGCLVRERLVEHLETERRYVPGPMLFELGLARPAHGAFQRRAIAEIARLDVGADAGRFVCLRSGPDFVCAGRLGPAAGYSLHEGARWPLVASAAGIAMLVAHDEPAARALFDAGLARLGSGARNAAAMRVVFDASLAAGLAINEGRFTPGWNSYAVAVRDRRGEPFASIMVTAPAAGLGPARVDAIRAALRAAADRLHAHCVANGPG